MMHCLTPGPPSSRDDATRRLPHILVVVDGFPKVLGGGERVVLRLAGLLPAYGFRASILTLALHPETSFEPAEAPCPVYLLPLTRTYDWTALRSAFELIRFIEREEVRLVQTFFESSDLWAGAVIRALTSARLIWSRRDMGILRQRKHRLAYRAMRHLPDAVLAVSEQVRRHVIEVDGVDPVRVRTVHNGIALPPRRPMRSHAEGTGPVVLTIGNIRRVKGHDLLLRAAAVVLPLYPGLRVRIAGAVLEPDFFAELSTLADTLGIGHAVEFLGEVTDLPEALQRSDLFVLPSRSEGFSNALVEAMACCLPVIATDVGGNREAVEDGVTGRIVPAEDAPALGQAMLALLDAPERARAMGERARRAAEQEFSLAAMMQKTIMSYREVL